MTPDHQADARRIVDDAQVDPKSPQWHWLSSAIAAALSRAYEAGARDGSLRIEDTYQAILRLHGIGVQDAFVQHTEGATNKKWMDDWRLIETGPRNATDVELLLDDGKVVVGHWEEQPAFQGWFVRGDKHDSEVLATHWRPLAAPAPAGKGET